MFHIGLTVLGVRFSVCAMRQHCKPAWVEHLEIIVYFVHPPTENLYYGIPSAQ